MHKPSCQTAIEEAEGACAVSAKLHIVAKIACDLLSSSFRLLKSFTDFRKTAMLSSRKPFA
eukprot:7944575-Karenia_brevis.AAC.1